MKLPINRVLAAGILASGAMLILPSCAVTAAPTAAAQNEPAPATPQESLVPVAKVQPLTVAANRRLPRAMWVWDATVITNTKHGQNLFDFCAQKGISTIYLDMGDLFAPKSREIGDPKHITAKSLGEFLQTAHGKKIEVEALDGDPTFALEAGHPIALGILKKALAYNKAAPPDQKLDGFQWDTEPYTMPEFNKDAASQRVVLKQYLDGALQLRDAAKTDPSMRLGFAIPSFFDEETRALEWNGSKKAPAFHLMDTLNTLPASYVAIMAYRDKAPGPNGTIEISKGEIDYAVQSAPKVKVWIGQETLDVTGDPPSITFYQEGENALEQALGQTQDAYKTQPALAGLAIHHWESYRAMKAGEPIVAVKPLGPITEPLTILSPKTGEAVPKRMEVSGTAKPGGAGVKIEVSVRPDGDIWYSQGEVPLADDGTWSVTGRFGNEATPVGGKFEVRAQLKKADGAVVTERIITIKTG